MSFYKRPFLQAPTLSSHPIENRKFISCNRLVYKRNFVRVLANILLEGKEVASRRIKSCGTYFTSILGPTNNHFKVIQWR